MGQSERPEYIAWRDMRNRCINPRSPSYKNYGARGITVDPVWLSSFEAFLADVGPRPGPGYSIDRVDNDKGYEPGNVRWATKVEQENNKRSNHYVTVQDRVFTVAQLARGLSIPYETLKYRLYRGWPLDTALDRPVRKYSHRNLTQAG